MSRREFPKSVRVAVTRRAMKDGVLYCEACGGQAKRFQIDHIRPDGLLGEPILENAQLICQACWEIKNPKDTAAIAKAKRREARHVGVTRPDGQIQSRGFAPSEKPKREPLRVANGLTGIARQYGVKA